MRDSRPLPPQAEPEHLGGTAPGGLSRTGGLSRRGAIVGHVLWARCLGRGPLRSGREQIDREARYR